MPRLMTLYREYVADREEPVFVRKLAEAYTPATLERLSQHANRHTRRAAVFALGLVGGYEANGALGRAMNDLDRGVRILAETAIRAVWCRAGSELQRVRLMQIIELNDGNRFHEAQAQATALIEQAPWFAEAWNQRAVSFYGGGRFVESIRDCQQTLEINPYHFGAAAGMGHCYMQLGNHTEALVCFRRALRLNPNLEGVRGNIVALQRLLKEK
jgi:tetratricopeptide (TPR) repeat protein